VYINESIDGQLQNDRGMTDWRNVNDVTIDANSNANVYHDVIDVRESQDFLGLRKPENDHNFSGYIAKIPAVDMPSRRKLLGLVAELVVHLQQDDVPMSAPGQLYGSFFEDFLHAGAFSACESCLVIFSPFST